MSYATENVQAALFADPVGRCLSHSLGDNEPPPERLGPFTCIADAKFFLRAVGEALRFPSVVVVDVDISHPGHSRARSPCLGGPAMGLGSDVAFAGLGSELWLKQVLLRSGSGLPSKDWQQQ